jgi:hypothetical protein
MAPLPLPAEEGGWHKPAQSDGRRRGLVHVCDWCSSDGPGWADDTGKSTHPTPRGHFCDIRLPPSRRRIGSRRCQGLRASHRRVPRVQGRRPMGCGRPTPLTTPRRCSRSHALARGPCVLRAGDQLPDTSSWFEWPVGTCPLFGGDSPMDESSRVLTLGLAAPDGLFSQVGAASPLRTDTFRRLSSSRRLAWCWARSVALSASDHAATVAG